MKKWINGIFAALVCLALGAGLAKAAAFPAEINEYENRYAEKLQWPSLASVRSGEFQEQTEAALADQLPFAEKIKEGYNRLFSAYNSSLLSAVMAKADVASSASNSAAETAADPVPHCRRPSGDTWHRITLAPSIADPNARYFTLPSGRAVLKDHLMYGQRKFEDIADQLDSRIANINSVVGSHPAIDFYAYYIEKETDVNFVEGTRTGAAEYLEKNLKLNPHNFNLFRVTAFEDFDDWFYKTDHHLNHRGGLELYHQLLAWLLPQETALEPTGEYEIGYYSGSKATGTDAQNYKDMNACYSYDYPQLITYENGKKIGYYGAQDYYIDRVQANGKPFSKVSYGQLFGQDSGEIRFENPKSENGSILVFGESFDNAILRLLAGHFSKLYSIDLRNYKAQMKNEFDLDSYLSAHPDIDRILFIGNMDFYISDSFNL